MFCRGFPALFFTWLTICSYTCRLRKTIYLLRIFRLPRSFCKGDGEKWTFAPPLPYLWSIACAAHLIILIRINSFLPKQLLPENWITNEENSCYLNSLLPSNFGNGTLFSLHVHHAYLNISPNIWVIFYSNPLNGFGGKFFVFQLRGSPP